MKKYSILLCFLMISCNKISEKSEDIAKGKELFTTKNCIMCHNITSEKLIGPGLKNITKSMSIEWIGKMILNPEIMVQNDDKAKELFDVYKVPMPNMSINSETELPYLLSYLKSLED